MSSTWTRFYDAAKGGAPRDTLLLALDRFDTEQPPRGRHRLAVDLGCGEGRDTAEILRRGWHVVAIDAEAEAIERLRTRSDLGPDGSDRLETRVARFEDAVWPKVDLVNSSFALPFCAPEHFPSLWDRLIASLHAGGRFCGHLFGERDGWAPDPELSFHPREEIVELLAGFGLERFDEVEEDGKTALGEAKHWHVFHIVARKR